MHAELRLSLPVLYGFLIALARVSGVVAFVPIPGLRDAPEAPRVVLALALTFVLLPVWPSMSMPDGISTTGLAVAAAAEFSIGLLMGLTVAVLLESIQLAAQMIGLPAGFSYASTVDPTTQADSSVLQIMMQLLAGCCSSASGSTARSSRFCFAASTPSRRARIRSGRFRIRRSSG